MIKLPVKINASIKSEPWIYNKLALIEASDHGKEWMAGHFDIFMDGYIRTWFGENNRTYDMEYFRDILSIEEIHSNEAEAETIDETVRNEIKKNSYIIIDLNLSANAYIKISEVLIYGYDDSGTFFYLNRDESGDYEEERMTSQELISAFSDAFHYYKYNPAKMLERRKTAFGISRVRLNSGYRNDNSVCNAIMKMKRERSGSYMDFYIYDENKPTKSFIYTGTQCLKGVENGFEILYREKGLQGESIGTMARSLNKLLEHRKIILESMKWLSSEIDDNSEKTMVNIKKYEHICFNLKSIVILANNLYKTQDENVVPALLERIKGQYDEERQILGYFTENASRIYISHQMPDSLEKISSLCG